MRFQQTTFLNLATITITIITTGIVVNSEQSQHFDKFEYSEQQCPSPETFSDLSGETKTIKSPKFGIQFSLPVELMVVPDDRRGVNILRREIVDHIRCQERLRALGWSAPGRGMSVISIYKAQNNPSKENLNQIVSQNSPMFESETVEIFQRGEITGYLSYGDMGGKLALKVPSLNQPVIISDSCDCNGYKYSASTLKRIADSLEPFSKQ